MPSYAGTCKCVPDTLPVEYIIFGSAGLSAYLTIRVSVEAYYRYAFVLVPPLSTLIYLRAKFYLRMKSVLCVKAVENVLEI